MAAGVRNRHYRNSASDEGVWAQRMVPHNGGAMGTGDWHVRSADGKVSTIPHAEFAATHVPALSV